MMGGKCGTKREKEMHTGLVLGNMKKDLVWKTQA